MVLQNVSANQRDQSARRGARRAQTRKLTFFNLFFEHVCTVVVVDSIRHGELCSILLRNEVSASTSFSLKGWNIQRNCHDEET